jgi:glycosyltransferase involved in cell wall biosynthesis
MKFSICIPNYNYGQYIGQTIQSVLDQDYGDFEILVSDNKSTDNSWEIIQKFVSKDSRVSAWENPTNLGFAGNLDAVSSKAKGEYQLLVSSDDLMNLGALDFYFRFLQSVGEEKIVFSASCNRIDANGNAIGLDGPKSKLWFRTDIDNKLSEQFSCPVYKVPSDEMLRRCLASFYGPFNFVATCYSTYDYLLAGAYGGSRMYNPDKWMHWKLLALTDFAYYIDEPLFSYRWHPQNQAAQQRQTGALKYFLDDYRSSFELDDNMLKKSGLNLKEIKASFIYNVIQKNTFSYLKQGQLIMARRIFNLGWAAYPEEMCKSWYSWILAPLLKMGQLGVLLVRPLMGNYKMGL